MALSIDREKGPRKPSTDAPGYDEVGCFLKLAQELNLAADLETGLKKVALRLAELVDYDTFGVLLLDELRQELRIRYGHGLPSEVVEHWRFGLGQGLVGIACQTQKAVLSEDVTADPHYIQAVEGLRSELAIPLVVKNRTIGVLDVGSREPHHFTVEHQRLLTFLSGHLAHAIENARLNENMREQARTLSLLHEMGRELTAILDKEELLRQVAEGVKRLIDYDLFNVMLWNGETQTLQHAFALRFDQRDCPVQELPLGYGLCGTAAALRQSIRVPNVDHDPRYVACDHSVDVRSELVVPLLFKDRLIGVMDLESVATNAFSERHEQLLSTLASSVANALENVRLYDKLKEEEERLHSDLATARQIQLQLLPKSRPWVSCLQTAAGYLPARHLGGDLYDFLPCGENRTLVAVGDVAGKATAAALYGSLAVGMLRGHVIEHPCSPARLLAHMNENLRQLQIDRRFVALAVARYDCRDRQLTVANSGLPRPRLVRRGRVEEIPVDGVPLGLLADVDYREERVELVPGDVVVFHSDGLQECVNPSGEEYGLDRFDERLKELHTASVEEIVEGLMAATSQHIGNAEPSDDRTLVVLKVTGCPDY